MDLQRIHECSPDKQAEIAFELAKHQARVMFWRSVGNGIETWVSTLMVLFTLFILVHPGANHYTTKWYLAIEWLHWKGEEQSQPNSENSVQSVQVDGSDPVKSFAPEDQRIPSTGDMVAGYEVKDVRRIREVHPVTGQPNKPHYGFDLATPVGIPLKMPLNGNVTCTPDGQWGIYAIATFPELPDHEFLLHHLSECHAGEYQQGQEFGKTGDAGTGPHLHIEKHEFITGEWEALSGEMQTVDGELKPVDVEIGWFKAFLNGELPVRE